MIIYVLTFYLFDDIEQISKSLMWIILQRQKQFWQNCSCNRNVYIFYLRFALGIIHGDHCDRKTPKTVVLFKENPSFRSLNLVTLLLFEEILVLTSYLRKLQ